MVKTAVISSVLQSADRLPPERMGIGPNSVMSRTLHKTNGGSAVFYDASFYAKRCLDANRVSVAPLIRARWTLRETWRETRQPIHPAADIDGLARRAQPTLETVLRAGVNNDHLKRIESQKLRGILEAAIAWKRSLNEDGYIPSAELFHEAAERVAPRERMTVWGFARLYPEELDFIDAASGDESLMYFPSGDFAMFSDNRRRVEEMRARGWRIEHREEPPTTVGGKLAYAFLCGESLGERTAVSAYADIDEETRGVLAQVKRLLMDGVSPGEIAITARDEPLYGAHALAVAREYEVPLRAFYQIPLAETRVGTWLLLALECAQEDYPFESAARLLRHPFTDAKVGYSVWHRARRERPQGCKAWRQQGAKFPEHIISKELTRGDFIQWIKSMIDALLEKQEVMRLAREVIAWQCLEEGLKQLEQWKPSERINLNSFVSEIREVLNLQTVAISPGRGGVELHSPLSMQGARFKHVFVLGMAEGVTPAAIQDDPVLDFHARMRLHEAGLPLEGPVERAHREAISFWAMLHAATTSIHFSYPRVIHGKEKLPSPFLERINAVLEEPPRRVVVSIHEKRQLLPLDGSDGDDLAPHAARSLAIELRRECETTYDEFDGVMGEEIDPASRVFSVTQLTQLGQCPFKWFGRRVLRLEEPEEAEMDLTPKTRGDFCHRALRIVMEESSDEGDPRTTALARLEAAFQKVESEMRLERLPAWPARRRELLDQLRRAIQGEAFLLDGCRVLFREKEFETVWRGLRIRGIIDRIDESADGVVLVDYKTSSQKPPGAQDEKGKATLDLQLEIYAQAVDALLPNARMKDAYYYSLTKARKLGGKRDSEETYAAFVDAVKRRLREGRYPVAPDVDEKACEYCELDALCRKGPRLARKEETP